MVLQGFQKNVQTRFDLKSEVEKKEAIKIKKRYLTAIIFTILILTISAGTALAADVTGSVSILTAAPSVDTLTLKDLSGNTVTAMSPTVPYRLSIPVSDNNTLDDIANINITIYNGAQPQNDVWNSSGNVNYVWIPGWEGPVLTGWEKANGAAVTSWTLNALSTKPVLTGTSGTWELVFAPGKLARSGSGWQISVTVTDSESNTATANLGNLSMNSYISMSVISDPTVDFGSLAPGNTSSPSAAVLTSVMTNSTYSLQSSTTAWTSGANTLTPMSGIEDKNQFVLDIGDTTSPTQPLTTTAADIAGYNSLNAPYTADDADENYAGSAFYLQLELAPTIDVLGTYTGTITMTGINP
jgi:hypothetical protein